MSLLPPHILRWGSAHVRRRRRRRKESVTDKCPHRDCHRTVYPYRLPSSGVPTETVTKQYPHTDCHQAVSPYKLSPSAVLIESVTERHPHRADVPRVSVLTDMVMKWYGLSWLWLGYAAAPRVSEAQIRPPTPKDPTQGAEVTCGLNRGWTHQGSLKIIIIYVCIYTHLHGSPAAIIQVCTPINCCTDRAQARLTHMYKSDKTTAAGGRHS